MNKDDLKKLRQLRKEKQDLERRIIENRFETESFVADTAKDYRTGYGKTIVIRGYGDDSWAKLQEEYKDKAGRLTRKILELERFIDTIEDAEIRRILRMRYEDGMTQSEVGEIEGFSRQAIEKKEREFWNSQK